MKRPFWFLLCAAAAGCGGRGMSSLFVTVDGAGAGVDHLVVTVENDGQASQPATLSLSGAPVDLPPAQTFSIRFSPDRSGSATVTVQAIDKDGHALASGSGSADLISGQEVKLLVTLAPTGTSPHPDAGADIAAELGAADMAIAPQDLRGQDLAAPAADLASSPDLRVVPMPDLSSATAPAVSGVSPSLGSSAGGITIHITGNHFAPGATATVSGIAVSNLQWVSAQALTGTLPAHPGALGPATVVVRNPDGESGGGKSVFSYYLGALAFLGHKDYPAGTNPVAVAVGDYDGDGARDVVATNAGSGSVSFLSGNGDGSLRNAMGTMVGLGPSGIIAVDVEANGKLDYVVSLKSADGIGVVLGNGNGTFQTVEPAGAGAAPSSVAAADFNHDGHLDIAVGDSSAAQLSILLGNGDGTFRAPTPAPAGNHPSAIVAGDFDADGNMDIAVTNQSDGNVGVLLGKGDGTFQAQKTYTVGQQPAALAIADLNGDGHPDLVTADSGSGTVSVLLDFGGDFVPASPYTAGAGPSSVAVADFNADGQPDVAVANATDGTVSVLLGAGSGTLSATSPLTAAVGPSPQSVAAADFDGDGKPDLVLAVSGNNNVALLLNSSQ